MGRVGKGIVTGLAALVGVGSLAVAPAAAEDPLFVPWSELLPSLTTGYDPSSANDCKAGRIRCVDSVIREMERRYEPLRESCDHDAMFALTYLRTTQEYRRSVADGTFFEDTSFVNHQDAVFARYYFDAFDAWHRGDVAATPPAWRVAFDAADRRLVSGTGNLLLGMSSHVNRDLAFVLADIGLVQPDGSTRKTDHDKVNEFLNRVMEPLLAEAAATLDPTVDDGQVAWTTLDETLLLQLLVGWREQAWRNAERLVAASTPEARAQVAADIEAFAVAENQLIVAGTQYGALDWLLGRRAARDSFCAGVNG
jgi:hypothetical protein